MASPIQQSAARDPYQKTEKAAAPMTGAQVKGYRKLSDDEVAMMNELKSTSKAFIAQMNIVGNHVAAQKRVANITTGEEGKAEMDRLLDACPEKWMAKAITAMQEACMYGCRAIAQPSGES